jgi:hypothetical protein
LVAIWFTEDPGKPDRITTGVSEAKLADTLPQLTSAVAVQQLQGFRLTKESGSLIYYFEYEADHIRLIQEISRLQFSVDSSRVDLQLREAEPETLLHIQTLLQDKLARKYFSVTNDDYLTLECIKGDQQHYLLLSNHSDRVIHLVEKV